MKIRNLYDNEGNTEQDVMTQAEITQIVSDFDETGEMMDLLTTEGLFQYGQNFGDRCELEIDTRNGQISTHTAVQNSTRFEEPFYITLVKISKDYLEDDHVCEGAEMIVTVSGDHIVKNIPQFKSLENLEELELKKVGKNLYEIDWRLNTDYIDAENFVENFMDEKWEEWVDRYIEWAFGDITIDYSNIAEYYEYYEKNGQ